MTYILCIETATEVCSVALYKPDGEISELHLPSGNKHSAGLTPLIKKLLNLHSVKPADISAVAVSDGPGSYTGLRVGCSTAKGICYAHDIPLIAIPTLEALANGILDKEADHISADSLIMPTIDARRMEVYTSIFDRDLRSVVPVYNLIYSQETISELVAKNRPLIICGNGAAKLIGSDISYSPITVLPTECDARDMITIARKKYQDKDFADVAYHHPFYYKAPHITRPRLAL